MDGFLKKRIVYLSSILIIVFIVIVSLYMISLKNFYMYNNIKIYNIHYVPEQPKRGDDVHIYANIENLSDNYSIVLFVKTYWDDNIQCRSEGKMFLDRETENLYWSGLTTDDSCYGEDEKTMVKFKLCLYQTPSNVTLDFKWENEDPLICTNEYSFLVE
ncbi:MAG: hypothetical protein V1726_06250 [Methanobacteriota archaeon]